MRSAVNRKLAGNGIPIATKKPENADHLHLVEAGKNVNPFCLFSLALVLLYNTITFSVAEIHISCNL